MCLDSCYTSDACTRPELAFACDATSRSDPGWCRPPAPSLACIPQAQFVTGTKKAGACCDPANDGTNSIDCEGGRCGMFSKDGYDGPYACNRWCDSNKDCPGGWSCSAIGICMPLSFPYECKD